MTVFGRIHSSKKLMNMGGKNPMSLRRVHSLTNLTGNDSSGRQRAALLPARSQSAECVRGTHRKKRSTFGTGHSGSSEIAHYTSASGQILKGLLENSSTVEKIISLNDRVETHSSPRESSVSNETGTRQSEGLTSNLMRLTGKKDSDSLHRAWNPPVPTSNESATNRNSENENKKGFDLSEEDVKFCSSTRTVSLQKKIVLTRCTNYEPITEALELGTREQSAPNMGSLKVFDGDVDDDDDDDDDDDAAYGDIVRLLQAIEEDDHGDSNSGDGDGDGAGDDNLPKLSSYDHGIETFFGGFDSAPHAIDSDLKNVSSFLDEMEKEPEKNLLTTEAGAFVLAPTRSTACGSVNDTTGLEDIMSADPVELAHEILSLRVQIEDQRKGIQVLRATLSETKNRIAFENVEHEAALNRANSEAEALVRRHQKFIKQLLAEKKSLNDTITKLVEDIKGQEEKFKRNIKALEDRHQVDVKRVREAQGNADKIKREKWMEVKTQKIKEMTVKSLEPELSRLAAEHQSELADLKNAHRAELEALESRVTRRASQLMDDLRAELLKERASAIEKATADLRCRMERDFEEERNRSEAAGQRLKEELRRQEDKADRRESEFRQRLADAKREADEEIERLTREFRDKLEEARRQQDVQVSSLRAAAEREKENWANEYRRQESVRFSELEAELQQRFKRDRDRDIEAIIEALEKESAQLQLKMTEEFENKLKRLREKLEKEVQEAEANEAVVREKLSNVKCQMADKEETISRLGFRVRELEAEAETLRERCDRMTLERTNMKEIIREEFRDELSVTENKKRILEKEVARLKETHLKELAHKDRINIIEKNRMQKELAKVYDRIKVIVGKKEAAMEILKKENDETRHRCQRLETLLAKQTERNLLIQ